MNLTEKKRLKISQAMEEIDFDGEINIKNHELLYLSTQYTHKTSSQPVSCFFLFFFYPAQVQPTSKAEVPSKHVAILTTTSALGRGR